jgi:hypothetical protein
MPARRHRFKKCNHLGFGSSCRRCLTADRLDQKVAKQPQHKDAQAWTNEANRLRGTSGKKPIAVAATDTVRSNHYEDDGYGR